MVTTSEIILAVIIVFLSIVMPIYYSYQRKKNPKQDKKSADGNEIKNYIQNVLAKIKYPYENDSIPNTEKLIKDLVLSSSKMYERLNRIKLIPDMDVYIKVEDKSINILSAENPKGKIECSLDLRLLKRILDRKSHWNNAEIGCHIEFNRSPNYYSPDIHTALQFLHL